MVLQEKFLHHIWDQRHLIPELKTVNGKAVRIIYQGQYNTSNGPDFKNVILNLDGETITGDVEIHLKTYDWTAHEHQEDPAYNNTILHVVLKHNGNQNVTIREDAGEVEILELQNHIDEDIAKLFVIYETGFSKQHAGICDFFKLSLKEQLNPLLHKYGWERFSRKYMRYNAELHFDGFDQLLYNGFMEAVGYDKNKFNTLSLAHHFKWDTLCEWSNEGLDAITLASIWLNYANLTDKAEKLLTAGFYQSIKSAFEAQSLSSDKGNLSWNLFRIRPANHPIRRILQASQVVLPLTKRGFLNILLDVFNADQLSVKHLVNNIKMNLQHVEQKIPEIEKIGQVLMQTIIANIFLPILYLYSEKTHNKDLMQNIKNVYYDFPPLGSNYILSFMEGYIDPEQWKQINSSYINQQGMMNIYYKFCNYRLCSLCVKDKDSKLMSL